MGAWLAEHAGAVPVSTARRLGLSPRRRSGQGPPSTIPGGMRLSRAANDSVGLAAAKNKNCSSSRNLPRSSLVPATQPTLKRGRRAFPNYEEQRIENGDFPFQIRNSRYRGLFQVYVEPGTGVITAPLNARPPCHSLDLQRVFVSVAGDGAGIFYTSLTSAAT